MPVRVVILWSDALLFLLLAVILCYIWFARRHEHLLAPWRKVATSRAGMCSLMVLMFFVAVGLLDSLHFRPRLEGSQADGNSSFAVEVLSVLDLMAKPLRSRSERTYSEPLSAYSFAKETVDGPDGVQERVFPRLKFGGGHLTDPTKQTWPDVARRALGGLGLAAALWIGLSMLVAAWLAHKGGLPFSDCLNAIVRGETQVPWREMLVTAGAVLIVLTPMLVLGGYYHVLGTDKVGQDVFFQALKSIRTGLVIGTLTTLIMLPFALLLGLMAGYFGGLIDDVIHYLYTTLNSIPSVLLIAASILILQAWLDRYPDLFETVTQRADLRLLILCAILGLTSWTGLCRLLRGEALKLREMEYVQAARAFGVSDWRIMIRHLLPNVMHIVLIAVVMDFSGLVLAEAVLSYVGVGVDPSTISFGTMINNARLEMAREPMIWWSLAAAFCFMFVLVLAANLFSDAVRDAFDPRIRSGWSFLQLTRWRTAPRAA